MRFVHVLRLGVTNWFAFTGTTAGKQCVGQCPIVGSEDIVCGWYPFEQSLW